MTKSVYDYATIGVLEIKRQFEHYKRLGEDKPADHEYNETAEGLRICFNRLKISRREAGNLPEIPHFLKALEDELI